MKNYSGMGKMRRSDRELDRAETDEILANGIYGVLSMNGDDGFPYGVPLNYVYTGDSIYLHGAVEGERLARIQKDNSVSFCVVGKASVLPEKFSIDYSSAIVFGKANIIVEDEQKLKIMLSFVDKYSGAFKEKGEEYAVSSLHKVKCIRIDIERITGKARK
jgi:nitroimidazol reductase NimA-like FMN-containing flavoprotein (pyridoxamine 5'-phosphate oxidase superfamily)